jgi:hypothetical protein
MYIYHVLIELLREISSLHFCAVEVKGKSAESQDIVVHTLFTICPIESPLDIRKQCVTAPPVEMTPADPTQGSSEISADDFIEESMFINKLILGVTP